MKKISGILTLLVLLCLNTTNFACNNIKPEKENAEITASEIIVYYFHNTRRCATCVAVEDVTKKALEELFPTEFRIGDIKFISVNLEEKKGKEIAEKVKVARQTLVFISGDKRKDLTNDAFMYARTKPEKLKKKIKEAIKQFQK